MASHVATRVRSQRSQSMVEFAIVAPLLLLLIFVMVDFGRVIYTYITLNQAVNEAVRVAIRDSALLPTYTDVESAAKNHAVDVSLANPCVGGGPIKTSGLPANHGWIFITDPIDISNLPSPVETFLPGLENAPGGQMWAFDNGNCSATNPAHNHAPLQVTIVYNFVPITPLFSQFVTNSLIIKAAAVYRTEY